MDVTDFDPPSHVDVQADLRELFRGAIRVTLEMMLEEEVRELVGVGRWQKSLARKDKRNGSYLRGLMTSMGHLEVTVPRTRSNGSAGEVLGRYKRRTAELDDAITSAYVQGVSTRKMSKVTNALMGEDVSRSTVSRVTKSLGEHVEALRKEPLTQRFPYLYLDATFLDARWARTVENVSALVAYGVGENGHRHLLAITLGASESRESWADLLRQLLERGLAGVQLVIADGHAGLAAAVRQALPEARLQVHRPPNSERPRQGPLRRELLPGKRVQGRGGDMSLGDLRPHINHPALWKGLPPFAPARRSGQFVNSFGSEEAGLRGSRRYVECHLEELRRLDARLLNFETVAHPEVVILSSDVNGTLKHPPGMVRSLALAAERAGIPFKVSSSGLGWGPMRLHSRARA